MDSVPAAAEPIRVVIVDDDALVRGALTLMLGGAPDISVIGDAADGHDGLALIARLRPDVVLMDIRMPRVDGLTATSQLCAEPNAPKVIVLTTFDADDYVLQAVAAGAEGFLLKDTPPAGIVDAIRRVHDGETMLSAAATAALVKQVRSSGYHPAAPADPRLTGLTDREREVAIALGHGLSNADIAAELFISVATVKSHVTKLFEKLGTTNRVQIALLVHDAGWLTPRS